MVISRREGEDRGWEEEDCDRGGGGGGDDQSNRKNGRSGYKGETVSQFTNPDFRSRTSIHVFTLTAPISFLSISLLSDSEERVFLAAFTSVHFPL